MTDEYITDSLLKDRKIYIYNDIDATIGIEVIQKLHYLAKDRDSSEPVTIFIFSDGGDLEAAMSIIDTIVSLRSQFIIRTVAYKAASAAAYILAMGTPGERYVFENSIIMLHKTAIELPYDDEDKQKLYIEFSKSQTNRIYETIAKSCGKKKEVFINDISKDLWLDSKAAKKYKIIDKIIKEHKELW